MFETEMIVSITYNLQTSTFSLALTRTGLLPDRIS